jgi:AmmeMemoRadiSam system protein A
LDLKHAALKEEAAAFVTLTKDGQLRGCIGYLEAVQPLGVTVQRMAVAAALHDTRFRPVQPEEVKDIHIEISVLSPMVPCEDVNEIEVGRHGLVIEQGRARGVLLPQVPTDYGWDRGTYLKQICRKAGLPPHAWKESDTRLWTFEAEVFGEHQAKTGKH